MSTFNEISRFIEKILSNVEENSKAIASEVANEIGKETAKYISDSRGNSNGNLGSLSGRLKKALQEGTESSEIGIENGVIREINIHYLRSHEFGDSIPLTERMRRAMFYNLKKYGYYRKDYIAPKQGYRAIKKKEIVEKGMNDVREETIAKKILPYIEAVFLGGNE